MFVRRDSILDSMKKIIISISLIFLILIANISPIVSHTISTKHNFFHYDPINEVKSDINNQSKIHNLCFSYQFQNPKIINYNLNNSVQQGFLIQNLSTTSIDERMKIPVKELMILLPQNHVYKNHFLSIIKNEIRFPFSHTEKKHYYQDIFPTYPVEIKKSGFFRGYSLLYISLYPIFYDVKNKDFVFSNTISFFIETKEKQVRNPLFRNEIRDEQEIIKKIENPLMLNNYQKHMKNPSLQYSDDSSNKDYQYVIITSDGLEQYFDSFVDYKNNYVSTQVTTLSYITANFDGKDLQEKIREFIRYAYQNWNTEYILLGGDVNIIPFRGLSCKAVDHTGKLLIDDNIPADIYYASLDGTWDDDGDGLYGEDNSSSICDEADFFAEVYIGRAPVENKVEIETFVNKVISFETSPKPKKILLHQSGINQINVPDSTIIPERISQWIPSDYEITKLYQVNQEINVNDWKSGFKEDNLIIQHTGNGEKNRYYIDYPAHTFSVYQAYSSLINDFYPIHTSLACNSGAFDSSDCLAETLLLNPYGGASACFFNSRWGFTSENNIHKYSGEFIERQFFELFYNNVDNLGKINQYAKESFYASALVDPAYRWCYYTINLLGDPETPVFETRHQSLHTSHFYVNMDYTEDTEGWNITHFNSIQASINKASNWDVIHVSHGVYEEVLSIDKAIQLIGENKRTTIISGLNSKSTMTISSSQVLIERFTITHNQLPLNGKYTDCSIDVSNAKYVTIADCIISNSLVGIYATGSNNLVITDNIFEYNQRNIYANLECGNLFIVGNVISLIDDDCYGIHLQAQGEYTICNNTIKSYSNISDFTCGIYTDGTSLIKHNTITHCDIGLWLTDGTHTIEHNIFRNNKHLAIYAFSSSVLITNNSIDYNGNGFIRYQNNIKPGGIIINASIGNHCIITDNVVSHNQGYGIFLQGLWNSLNKIYSNDFMLNYQQAFFINSRCEWNDNYWGKERLLPKIIFGLYQFKEFLWIPMFQFDLYPSTNSTIAC